MDARTLAQTAQDRIVWKGTKAQLRELNGLSVADLDARIAVCDDALHLIGGRLRVGDRILAYRDAAANRRSVLLADERALNG